MTALPKDSPSIAIWSLCTFGWFCRIWYAFYKNNVYAHTQIWSMGRGKLEVSSRKHIKCMGNKWNDRSVTVADHQDIMSELLHFRRLSKVLNYITSKYDTSTSDVLSSSGARYSSAMDAKPWDASKPERYSTKPPPPPHRSSTPGYGPGPKKHMASYLQDLKVSKKIVCIYSITTCCVLAYNHSHMCQVVLKTVQEVFI